MAELQSKKRYQILVITPHEADTDNTNQEKEETGKGGQTAKAQTATAAATASSPPPGAGGNSRLTCAFEHSAAAATSIVHVVLDPEAEGGVIGQSVSVGDLVAGIRQKVQLVQAVQTVQTAQAVQAAGEACASSLRCRLRFLLVFWGQLLLVLVARLADICDAQPRSDISFALLHSRCCIARLLNVVRRVFYSSCCGYILVLSHSSMWLADRPVWHLRWNSGFTQFSATRSQGLDKVWFRSSQDQGHDHGHGHGHGRGQG